MICERIKNRTTRVLLLPLTFCLLLNGCAASDTPDEQSEIPFESMPSVSSEHSPEESAPSEWIPSPSENSADSSPSDAVSAQSSEAASSEAVSSDTSEESDAQSSESSEPSVEKETEPPKKEPKKEEPKKDEPKKKEPEKYQDGDFVYRINIEPYLKYIVPTDPTPFLLLTNRANPLIGTKKWKPDEYFGEPLTAVEDARMTKTAAMAMKAMLAEAERLGVYDSYINNGYRSYDLQSYLYESYIKKEKGRHPDYSSAEIIALVDTYSAVPGTSEHQTGLAVDFAPVSSKFEKTEFYGYLLENAHKFGFILRYEQATIEITGYKAEPWHWRFVGRDAATYIHAHHITLEEYMEQIAPGKYKSMTEPKNSESVSEAVSEAVGDVSSEKASDISSEAVSGTADSLLVS